MAQLKKVPPKPPPKKSASEENLARIWKDIGPNTMTAKAMKERGQRPLGLLSRDSRRGEAKLPLGPMVGKQRLYLPEGMSPGVTTSNGVIQGEEGTDYIRKLFGPDNPLFGTGSPHLQERVMPQQNKDAERLQLIREYLAATNRPEFQQADISHVMQPAGEPQQVAQSPRLLPQQQPREAQPPLAAGTDEVQQARQLEQQASPRQERPTGLLGQLGRSALEGAAGLAHPGGYYGWQADRQATERQRQQDLLSRAQALRQQATQGQNAELAGRRLDIESQNSDLDRQNIASQIRSRENPTPQYSFHQGGPGQIQGILNERTGAFNNMGTTPPTERPATETEQDYVDYLRHPELVGKYGNDRVGFRKYQAAETQQRSINVYGATTAQNPTVLWGDDPDNPGKQKPYSYNKAANSLEPVDINRTPATAAAKEVAKKQSSEFADALKDISKRLITNKTALNQRIEALKRGGEAALGNDPDYRTYQDFRQSLAASIGISEQGSRISDYDVRGIYLPMIPDIFRDTEESAAMKWKLIEKKMGMTDDGVPPPPQGFVRQK